MYIKIEKNIPKVQDLPAGNVVLFFAKIDDSEYCVIFGPEEDCLPQKKNKSMSELWSAKVAFGLKGKQMKIHEVKHGHKYLDGGGFVETEDRGQIFFRTKESAKKSSYEGEKIKEVYIAL